jgi:hypothetical protein
VAKKRKLEISALLRSSAFHKWATIVWLLLAIPNYLWWSDLVTWVAWMSLYANVVGHWSAYQAARAEEK